MSTAARKPIQAAVDELFRTAPAEYRGIDKRLIAALRAALRSNGVGGDEAVTLAVELVAMDPALSKAARESLLVLAVTLQFARQIGRTSIGLAKPTLLQNLLERIQQHYPDETPLLNISDVSREIEGLIKSKSSPLIGAVPAKCPVVIDGDRAYIERLYYEESLVSSKIDELSARTATAAEIKKANTLVSTVADLGDGAHGARTLSPEQVNAVATAITAPVCAITGGPGTGKTTIVVSILRSLARMNVDPSDIALATFTGRAAFRLRQTILDTLSSLKGSAKGKKSAIVAPEDEALTQMMTRNPPKTLHRLLSANHNSTVFRSHRGSLLHAKWIIIDEASMIDINLASRLLDALAPDAHLIILGDVDQLPPIGAGAPFRDLLESFPSKHRPGFSVVRLTDSYRMKPTDPAGTNILTVASHIKDGTVGAIFADEHATGECIAILKKAKEIPDSKMHLYETNDVIKISEFLKSWQVQRLGGRDAELRFLFKLTHDTFDTESDAKLHSLFTAYSNARIFCLNNEGSHGVSGVDQLLHQHQTARLGAAPGQWAIGEPVMATKNDYSAQIYNGDIGITLQVRRDGEPEQLMAVFETVDGFRAFLPTRFGESLVSAFATTVHKAQGGETRHVALILPKDDSDLNTRALIYTAITRASDSVVVVGSREVFKSGVGRVSAHHGKLEEGA